MPASMGPRLDSRGERNVSVEADTRTTLQWGRGSIAAESQHRGIPEVGPALLQWGRGSIAAESQGL